LCSSPATIVRLNCAFVSLLSLIQPTLTAQVSCTANTAWGAVTVTGSPPPARAYASLVASPDGQLAYMFGGQVRNETNDRPCHPHKCTRRFCSIAVLCVLQTASGAVSNDLYILSSTAGFSDARAGTSELVNLAASPSAVAFQSSVAFSGFPALAISSQASPAYTNSLVCKDYSRNFSPRSCLPACWAA
jgi:hypothetical protein